MSRYTGGLLPKSHAELCSGVVVEKLVFRCKVCTNPVYGTVNKFCSKECKEFANI